MHHVVEGADDAPVGNYLSNLVANIVGILVLLAVIVGVRAGREVLLPEPAVAKETVSVETLKTKLDDMVRQAQLEKDAIEELAEKVVATLGEVERREILRESAVLYNTKLRAELDEERRKLNDGDQRSLETHNAIAQAQLKLDRLRQEEIALASVEPAPDAKLIEVTPSPIIDRNADARDIVTLRVKDDRIVYLPLREVTMDIAGSVKVPAVKSVDGTVKTRERSRMIDGFSGEMEVEWSIRVTGQRASFYGQPARLTLHEEIPQRGEALDQAFAPGSYIGSRLELTDPSNTIVEVYIYGDSFDVAPDVCQALKERGFRVAQRLQSDGAEIFFVAGGQAAFTQ